MDVNRLAAALRGLAQAVDHVADALDSHSSAGKGVPAARRSPTVDLDAIVVSGEEDLPRAFRRGHRALVVEGAGGLMPPELGGAERIHLLAITLAGDVALEAAHAGVQDSSSTIDAMLGRSLAVLTGAAEVAGMDTPVHTFLGAAERFRELSARGEQWR